MTVLVDGSTPPAVGSSGASTDSAAFTPPSNCILLIAGQADANNGSTETLTPSDSASGTWHTAVVRNGSGGAVVGFYWRTVLTSPGSMTVSLADSQGSVAKRLVPQVITGSDLNNPIGATTSGNTAAVSYVSTVNGSLGFSCGIGSSTAVTSPDSTIVDETGGFDGGDGVWTLVKASTTATAGTTVTLTEAGSTVQHHVAVEIVPPSSAPALPPPMLRRRAATVRAPQRRPSAAVMPQLPILVELGQPRRTRGQVARRARAATPVRAQVNPPIPPVEIAAPRRPKAIPPRRAKVWQAPLVPPVAVAPPYVTPVRPERLRLPILRRGGRALQPPQATPPANPPLPLGPIRRVLRFLVPNRRPRTAVPVLATVVPAAVRRRLQAAPARRGRQVTPVGVPVQPVAPALVPARIRIRQAIPHLRRRRMPLFVVASATCDCLVHRPNTGLVTRPSSGTVTRPYTGTVTRPCSC